MKSISSIGLAAILTVASQAYAQDLKAPHPNAPQAAKNEPTITIDAVGTDLRTLAEDIGRQVGRNILVDHKVSESVTLKLVDVPWTKALKILASVAKCEIEDFHDNVLVFAQPDPVSLQLQDVDIRELAQTLAKVANKNIVIAPQVKGTVSLNLKDISWRKALRAVVTSAGPFTVKESATLLQIVATEKLAKNTDVVTIDIDVKDQDLRKVIRDISRRVDRNILVAPGVRERITIKLTGLPWFQALKIIAHRARCELNEGPDKVLTLSQPPKVTLQFKDANIRTVVQLIAAYSGKSVVIAPEVQGRIAVDLKDVSWKAALQAVLTTAGSYVIVEESSQVVVVKARKKP